MGLPVVVLLILSSLSFSVPQSVSATLVGENSDNNQVLDNQVLDNVAGAPWKPLLLWPADLAVTDAVVDFVWGAGFNADNHRILIDNDSDLLSPVENVLYGPLGHTHASGTLAGGTYYWAVIAVNEAGESRSLTRSFVVRENAALDNQVPDAPWKPLLLWPADLAVTGAVVDFVWVVGFNADNHRILIDNDSDLLSPVENVLYGPLGHTHASGTLAGGTYYWAVIAVNEAGESRSLTRSFTILDNKVLDNQFTEKPVIVGFRDKPDRVLMQELGGDILEEWSRIPAIVCSLPGKGIDALMENPNIAYIQLDKEIHLVEPLTDAMIPVMVGFRGEPDPALIRELGGVITYEYTIIPTIACLLPAEAILVLQKNPKITHVELDGEIHAEQQTIPWGVERIGAPQVWTTGNKGTGVKIAILDSGIDYYHEDLDANYKGGYDFCDNDTDPMDDNGHGTHVAGIIAAENNPAENMIGVAPEAHIYAVKVLYQSGDWGGPKGGENELVAGIEWAIKKGMQVINMSLGTDIDSTDIANICDKAYDEGIVLVAASGSTGGEVLYPAAYDSVIAVGAIDSNNLIWGSSNRGPELSVVAPGVDIRSTYIEFPSPPIMEHTYATRSGTSMAVPHVTGTVALILGEAAYTPAEVRDILQETAVDLGPAGWDSAYGYGRIDAHVATTTPGFIIRVVPDSGEITGGESVTATVSVSPIAGFTADNVALQVPESDLPLGATASFDPPSGTLTEDGFTSTLTIETAPIIQSGEHKITIKGEGGGLTRICTYTLTVVDPDFAVSVSPESGSVVRGNSATATVTVSGSSSGTVSLSLNNTGSTIWYYKVTYNGYEGYFWSGTWYGETYSEGPVFYAYQGMSASLSAASGTPPFTSTLTISTTSSTPAGSYPITITGSKGEMTCKCTYTLTVIDFSVSVSPTSESVNAGSSTSATVTITSINGFSSTVSLSASGLPSTRTCGRTYFTTLYCGCPYFATLYCGYTYFTDYYGACGSTSFTDYYRTCGSTSFTDYYRTCNSASFTNLYGYIWICNRCGAAYYSRPSRCTASVFSYRKCKSCGATYYSKVSSCTRQLFSYRKCKSCGAKYYSKVSSCTAQLFSYRICKRCGAIYYSQVSSCTRVTGYECCSCGTTYSPKPSNCTKVTGYWCDSCGATYSSKPSSCTTQVPTGASISFSPSSGTPSFSSTMAISTSSTPAGTYTITITGTGGGATRTCTYTLTVT